MCKIIQREDESHVGGKNSNKGSKGGGTGEEGAHCRKRAVLEVGPGEGQSPGVHGPGQPVAAGSAGALPFQTGAAGKKRRHCPVSGPGVVLNRRSSTSHKGGLAEKSTIPPPLPKSEKGCSYRLAHGTRGRGLAAALRGRRVCCG